MATWKSYRVNDVVNDISEEKFVLPVIQRRFVWEEDKMVRLFDTLLKGDSFGGIMVIKQEKGSKPLFNYRPFTENGKPVPSRQIETLGQTQYFVIDGQQRLQTFYSALQGNVEGRILYFDLFSDYSSEFEFKFEKDSKSLPQFSRENADRIIPKHFWHDVKSLLNELKDTSDEEPVANEIIQRYGISDEVQISHIKKNIKAFLINILHVETLGISTVAIQKQFGEAYNKQRIVELFRRLNDGGTRLSSFDLVASILKGFAWEMENFLDSMLEAYSDIGLDQDNLIKLLFILRDDHKKEISSIEESDAEFAVKYKDRVACALKALKDFLIYSKLIDYYKGGKPPFIPLYFIVYHLFHKKVSDEVVANFFHNYDSGNVDYAKIKEWMFRSLISGVFRTKGAGWVPNITAIKKILGVMSNNKNRSFPTAELFKVYENHPLPPFTLNYSRENLDLLDGSFVFYIIYDKTAYLRIQDSDHIIPKSVLESLGFDNALVNGISNRQLIDYQTNRGTKNDTPFDLWIENPRYVKDKTAFIKKHLIPEEKNFWKAANFLDFSRLRSEKILTKLRENVSDGIR